MGSYNHTISNYKYIEVSLIVKYGMLILLLPFSLSGHISAAIHDHDVIHCKRSQTVTHLHIQQCNSLLPVQHLLRGIVEFCSFISIIFADISGKPINHEKDSLSGFIYSIEFLFSKL
jgi:hypothetical protein